MSTIIADYNPQGGQQLTRSATEKVAILLATLDNSLAVELLKKLSPEDVKLVLESSAGLGSLTFSDIQPLVDEFSQEFAEALGISASREQLMALLEAAFTSDEIASFLGKKTEKVASGFSWNRFALGAEATLVPFLLDEHPQTASVLLSRLSPDLAAKCIAILPSDLRASVSARMLRVGEVQPAVIEILERVLQEDVLGEKVVTKEGDSHLERLAAIINRLDRDQAYAIIDDITKISPKDGAGLRKLIFMFEDIGSMQKAHRAKLMDRVPTDLVISALFGADLTLRETILQSLSARTRRMVESELPAGESQPKKDTLESRRKIAELAIMAAKNGDIELQSQEEVAEEKAVA